MCFSSYPCNVIKFCLKQDVGAVKGHSNMWANDLRRERLFDRTGPKYVIILLAEAFIHTFLLNNTIKRWPLDLYFMVISSVLTNCCKMKVGNSEYWWIILRNLILWYFGHKIQCLNGRIAKWSDPLRGKNKTIYMMRLHWWVGKLVNGYFKVLLLVKPRHN